MKRARTAMTDRLKRGGMLLLTLAGLSSGWAQQPQVENISGEFSMAVANRATGRREWFIKGDRVNPVAKDRYAISGLRLTRYNTNGEPAMVAASDQCVFDSREADRAIYSTNRLKLDGVGNGLSMEGVGFRIQLDPAVLVLSNRVQAVLNPLLLVESRSVPAKATPAGVPGNLIHIESDRFVYQTNLAVFENAARFNGPFSEGTCQTLTLRMSGKPMEEQDIKLESARAEGGMTLASRDFRATARVAEYDPPADTVSLEGDPQWEWAGHPGGADAAEVQMAADRLHAWGNVRQDLPMQSLGLGNFAGAGASGPAARRTGETNPPVRIQADDLVSGPELEQPDINVTVFTGRVQVSSRSARLGCRTLTVRTTGRDHRALTAVSDGDVVVERENDRVACERSSYDAALGMIDLTGQPTWRFGEMDGRSDSVSLDVSNRISFARGNVIMKAPAEILGEALESLSGQPKSTNTPSTAEPLKAAGPPIELTCEEFEYRSALETNALDQAVWRRRVRAIQGTNLDLACERITAERTGSTNKVERVIADGGVVMHSRENESGRTVSGERIEYSAAPRRVEITGPNGVDLVETNASGTTRAWSRSLVYDVERKQFAASGQWKLKLSVPAKASKALQSRTAR